MATSSGISVICTRLAQENTDTAADEQRKDQLDVILGDDTKDGRQQRDRPYR